MGWAGLAICWACQEAGLCCSLAGLDSTGHGLGWAVSHGLRWAGHGLDWPFACLTMGWAGLTKTWDGLAMIWPWVSMGWTGLVMVWAGHGLCWVRHGLDWANHAGLRFLRLVFPCFGRLWVGPGVVCQFAGQSRGSSGPGLVWPWAGVAMW
jgi:hypothetical protein